MENKDKRGDFLMVAGPGGHQNTKVGGGDLCVGHQEEHKILSQDGDEPR